ncbi:ATP-dependent zinc protease family protein [Salinibacterium hongtaonis]|uniref:Retropepsin-like aspartic endopeptidase domain-containing protein n=1 Tax=Homoserinimonas hongtaonis TaxID=2079791 RepID=A0A2U1SX95_9MICO|nr:RimK/LysX family protein [Salinibacterium hongtaonis]PWB96208.1 hypothetical protein DF220_12640 [Salinibacterium hongtaonis]
MTENTYLSTIVGWREWVSLPGVEVPWIKAKLDTGARTSSLHAFDVEVFSDGPAGSDTATEQVRFSIHPWQESEADAVTIVRPVYDRRVVRSSSGHEQERIVVLLDVALAGRTVTAEVTLANRDSMGFRMLLGREALQQGFIVDSSRSFAAGRAPREIRRANRGR